MSLDESVTKVSWDSTEDAPSSKARQTLTFSSSSSDEGSASVGESGDARFVEERSLPASQQQSEAEVEAATTHCGDEGFEEEEAEGQLEKTAFSVDETSAEESPAAEVLDAAEEAAASAAVSDACPDSSGFYTSPRVSPCEAAFVSRAFCELTRCSSACATAAQHAKSVALEAWRLVREMPPFLGRVPLPLHFLNLTRLAQAAAASTVAAVTSGCAGFASCVCVCEVCRPRKSSLAETDTRRVLGLRAESRSPVRFFSKALR